MSSNPKSHVSENCKTVVDENSKIQLCKNLITQSHEVSKIQVQENPETQGKENHKKYDSQLFDRPVSKLHNISSGQIGAMQKPNEKQTLAQ